MEAPNDTEIRTQQSVTIEGQLTRKQRRQMERQGNRQSEASTARRRSFRRFVLWISAAALLVLAGWGMTKLVSRAPQTPGGAQTLSEPVGPQDHAFGSADAKVTLVEYSDFQCPACGAYAPLVQKVSDELGSLLRVVYRHFPLTTIHKNAQLAAQASEAASLQGKFWEYHDKLFASQAAWSSLSSAAAKEKFVAYAGELGLDAKRFSDDLESQTVKDRVKRDADAAAVMDLPGTPTFFVNGTVIESPTSYDNFKQTLQSAATR